MDIIASLNKLVADIATLQASLANAQGAAESIAKENYDKGFADGVASVPPVDGEKKFTQADLDAAVEAVRSALTVEMEALRLQVSDLQGKLDQATAELDQKIAEAVKVAIGAFKAELKLKFAEQQAKESSDEAEFGKLLDEVVVPEPIPEEPKPQDPIA